MGGKCLFETRLRRNEVTAGGLIKAALDSVCNWLHVKVTKNEIMYKLNY